jgi:hypothetical protein
MHGQGTEVWGPDIEASPYALRRPLCLPLCIQLFTMPWSPTKAFPSPLTRINSTNKTFNRLSYVVLADVGNPSLTGSLPLHAGLNPTAACHVMPCHAVTQGPMRLCPCKLAIAPTCHMRHLLHLRTQSVCPPKLFERIYVLPGKARLTTPGLADTILLPLLGFSQPPSRALCPCRLCLQA